MQSHAEAPSQASSTRTLTDALPPSRFDDRFVRTLPIDALRERGSRTVLGACGSLIDPVPTSAPTLAAWVPEVATLLGLPREAPSDAAEILVGNRLLEGMRPFAACYGGHQFGNWAGQLGDGRAITLGEVVAPSGDRFELQLKGAGRTPYSRGADGRAVLRSSLRELVCSEAMFHLGIPTTRALSLCLTGDFVDRDMFYDGRVRAEPGAITARVAPSFLRFGSFEIHAARDDLGTLEALARYAIETCYPELGTPSPAVYARMFETVCRRTAKLVVEWMRVGFVHGVLNTDNMSILGLTIDYGPYGWVEPFDPAFTPNTTDASGRRYRFGAQPRIALWNLERFAHALAPLVDDEEALLAGLRSYVEAFAKLETQMLLAKLGLEPGDPDEDRALLDAVFELLGAADLDMTLFYRRLAEVDLTEPSTDGRLEPLRVAFYEESSLGGPARARAEALFERYASHAKAQGLAREARRARMQRVNPIYVPRNYLAQLAIDAAEEGDTAPLHELLEVLRRPYDEQPGRERYAEKRPEWARSKPGCAMLSCSS